MNWTLLINNESDLNLQDCGLVVLVAVWTQSNFFKIGFKKTKTRCKYVAILWIEDDFVILRMSAMEPNGRVTNCNLDVYKRKGMYLFNRPINKITSLWEWEFSKCFVFIWCDYDRPETCHNKNHYNVCFMKFIEHDVIATYWHGLHLC